MICASLLGPTANDCTRVLGGLEMAEIRLDAMRIAPDEVGALFGGHPRLVATCRPAPERSPDQRLALLEAAVEGGAAYVDLELEAEPGVRRRLIDLARARGCRVIISHHDDEATPAQAELEAKRAACVEAGADLAKIACRVHSPQDCARLLGLLEAEVPTVVAGMGELGPITRLAALLLGAPFTYASLAPGLEAAPGQIDHATLARLLGECRAALRPKGPGP